ncbi:MAG: hypothetical protein ACRCZF_09710, partial [Gemmataceae bacterium]
MTQANTLFKRDLGRLQTESVAQTPLGTTTAADPAVLAFFWATSTNLLIPNDADRVAGPFPPVWQKSIPELIPHLVTAFFLIESWDPVLGYRPTEHATSVVPTAAILVLEAIATDKKDVSELADLLWEKHPSWPASLSKELQKTRGVDWVTALLETVFVPLGLVASRADGVYQLTVLGEAIWCGTALPEAPPQFPQTLLVQQNAEVLLYRQGLTPTLLSQLTRFASWKQIGAACNLELTAEETYRGLESGLTLAIITQLLERHGMRPTPPAMIDLLRRWADKRERISVFQSATLVEFSSAADLEAAIARGIVHIRLTDRVGLTNDGREPDFAGLRLVGNRDYESRPEKCVMLMPDGLTLAIDAAASDLLLEAELARFAELCPADSSG